MGQEPGPWFVCAACRGVIGVYECCLIVMHGEPVEITSLSLGEAERDAARAKGAYHRDCYVQGAAEAGSER